MNYRRKIFVKFILLIFPFLSMVAAKKTEPVVLQLRWDHQFQFAGYYVAASKGYYRDAGFDVTIRGALTKDKKILSATEEVHSGRATFGIGAADILVGISNGQKLVICATILQRSATRFFALESIGPLTPSRFTDLRVARIINDLIDVELQATLESQGIDPEKVKPYKHISGISHLLNKDVDIIPGYQLTVPYLAKQENIKLVCLNPANYGIDFYGDSLFVSGEYVQNHPEKVQRFIKASIRGWEYALKNKEETIQLILDEYPALISNRRSAAFNRYQADVLQELSLYPHVDLGHINPDRWYHMWHHLVQTKIIKEQYLDFYGIIFDYNRIKNDKSQKTFQLFESFFFIFATIIFFLIIFTFVLRREVRRRTSKIAFQADLLNSTAQSIIATDTNGTIIYWGSFAEKMYGWNAEEVIGTDISKLLVREEDTSRAQEILDNLIAGKTWSGEFKVKRKDGTTFWVWVTDSPFFDNKGNIAGIVGASSDITEKKKMEQRIHHVEKMEAISQLAGGIAHDFNNQLAAIMGYADMLSNRLGDQGLAKFANKILVATHKASDLTAKLLSFSPRNEFQLIPIDTHKIIDEVVDVLQHTIDKRVRITKNLQAKNSIILGSDSKIQDMLLNVCLNACDALEDNGEIVISTRLAKLSQNDFQDMSFSLESGDYLEISVCDTGCGIPKEIQKRVFEPFFTTKPAGKGTGLGLSAIYGTVQNHGGTLKLESQPGQGTQFNIYFLSVEKTPTVDQAKTDKMEMRLPGLRVLVIDDNLMVLDLLCDMIEAFEADVLGMNEPLAALDYYQNHYQEIDLVIMDMVMPQLNGAELFPQLKKINPKIKLLIVSGYSKDGQVESLLKQGAYGFIQKPYRIPVIFKAIQDCVNES